MPGRGLELYRPWLHQGLSSSWQLMNNRNRRAVYRSDVYSLTFKRLGRLTVIVNEPRHNRVFHNIRNNDQE
jgi:hypothetical protein